MLFSYRTAGQKITGLSDGEQSMSAGLMMPQVIRSLLRVGRAFLQIFNLWYEGASQDREKWICGFCGNNTFEMCHAFRRCGCRVLV